MLSRLLNRKSPAADAVPAFTKKPFFRSEQRAFYGRLRRALPKCYVFPDVELRALMTPISTDSGQRRSEKEYLLGRKVDYAVFNANVQLLCVIELRTGGIVDGTPGSNAQLLKSAGILHFCWDKQKLPTSEQMLRLFGSFMLPAQVKNGNEGGAANGDGDGDDFATDVVIPRATSLTREALDLIAPRGHLKAAYPHVFERIASVCTEPNHLDDYLSSLSIQSRASTRAGFPPEVLSEINEIELANEVFVTRLPAKAGWEDVIKL